MAKLEIRDYKPSDSEACLQLERQCPQGWPIRILFERPTFHARAEAYDRWRVLVALDGDTVVGTAASATKAVEIGGQPASGAFYFDGRIRPEYRDLSLACRMVRHLQEHNADVDIHYTHIFSSNRAAAALMTVCGFEKNGGVELLARPLSRRAWRAAPGPSPREASLEEVWGRHLELVGPRDVVVDPCGAQGHPGLIACLVGEEASCGVWSNATRFDELVQHLPRRLAAGGWLLDRWPLRCLPTPKIPRVGSALRGWFVFGVAAPDGRAAAKLVRHVEDRARAARIDCLYIVGDRSQPWFVEFERGQSSWLSATLKVDLRVHSDAGALPSPLSYAVDVRDL